MGKKETYYGLAEKCFVEDQIPVSGIAKKFNLTEKTVHTWKKEGNWEEKKLKFLKSQYSCYSALYELVSKMIKKINDDYTETGKMPEGSVLYFVKSMVDKLPKLKKFETDLITDSEAKNSEKDFNEDIIKKLNDKMLGIDE